jgi:hypothetical protein
MPGGMVAGCLLMGFALLLIHRLEPPHPIEVRARRADPQPPLEPVLADAVERLNTTRSELSQGFVNAIDFNPPAGGIRQEVQVRLRKEDLQRRAGF